MKLMYVGIASALILLAPLASSQSTPTVSDVYSRSSIVEADRVEIVYLPNNTCYVEGAATAAQDDYKDFVRACLNNQHLRARMKSFPPN
tara:strand:+ start:1554 stop:1820 length:267 start_codon:yes stop_codon:yes gene_type:complete